MNELIQLDDKEKYFLAWCEDYGASPLQVRALMSLGVPFEEALLTKAHRRIVLIRMNGQTKALSTWCRQYGIAPATLKKRMQAGYTFEEAFTSAKYQTHRIRAAQRKGEMTYTITKPFLDWCRDYLIDPLRVRAAMSMGYSLEYALKNTHKERINQLVMQVEGQTDTFLNFCSRYGKAANTIRRRVALGLPLAGAFGLPPFQKGEIQRLLELGQANESHCITQPLSEWCRDYNIPIKTAEQRIKMDMTIEQVLAAVPDTIKLNGEEISLEDLCMRLGLDTGAVKGRIVGGMSILEAINDAASRKIEGRVAIDGRALKAAREKAGLSQSQLAALVNGRGPFKCTKYVIHGLEHGKRLALPIECEALEAVLECSPLTLHNTIRRLTPNLGALCLYLFHTYCDILS